MALPAGSSLRQPICPAPGSGRDTQLIVADGLCGRIASLRPAARAPWQSLGPLADPLAAIGETLTQQRGQGLPLDTLHLVAHGRPGAIQLGGRWLSRQELIAGAAELSRWQLRRIALWSCELAQDPGLLALLAELSGAEIWASDQRIGAGHWRLRRHGTGSAHDAAAGAPQPPFDPTFLSLWPHHLDATMDDSLDLYNLTIGSGEGDAVDLLAALEGAESLISTWLQGEDALQNLYSLFGGSSSELTPEWQQSADSFLSRFLSGELSVKLEVRASEDLLGAYGAFAAAGPDGQPTIYLNEAWVSTMSLADLTRLIIEETGHWIDSQINGSVDSRGDEGEAFAATVLGQELSQDTWNRITNENDKITVTIDGVSVELELASLLFSSKAFYIGSSSTSTATQLETNIVYTYASVGALGVDRYLFISDPSADPIFSGNNTRGYLYVVNSSNVVTQKFFGEITRLYKSGSNVIGLQYYVYPPGYVAGSGDRTTITNNSILIDLGPAGFVSGANYNTSSDPISTALNALLKPEPAVSVADTGIALEKGGLNNNTGGADASGNVLSNDLGGLKQYSIVPNNSGVGDVSGVMVTTSTTSRVFQASSTLTSASGTLAAGSTVSSGATVIAGLYGTLFIGADGTYRYEVNNTNSSVQALRLSTNTLTDIFNYTQGTTGNTSVGTLSITIQGANDNPEAFDDYGQAKESLIATEPSGAYAVSDPLGYKATGNVLNNDTDVDAGDTKTVVTNITISGSGTGTTAGNSAIVFAGLNGVGNAPNLSSLNGGSYGTYILVGSTYVPVLAANGTITNFTISGTGSNLTQTVSDTTNIQLGTNLYILETAPSTYRFVGNVSSLSAPPASTIVNITAPAGSIAEGMVVSGTGIGSSVIVNSITYDASGNISSVTLNTAVQISGVSLTFAASQSVGSSLKGQYGTLVLNANGTYTYTPFTQNPGLTEGEEATEIFNYTMQDASGAFDSARLIIRVLGSGNNDPNAVDQSGNAVERGGILNGTAGVDPSGNLLAGATTPAGTSGLRLAEVKSTQDASGTAVNSADSIDSSGGGIFDTKVTGLYGDLFVDASGNYFYKVNNNLAAVQGLRTSLNTLTDTFSFRVANDLLRSEWATVTITIQGQNDNPVANNDYATAKEAGGLNNSIPGVDPSGNLLTNDTDVDAGDSKFVTGANAGSAIASVTAVAPSGETAIAGLYGTLFLSRDGTYRYVVNQSNSDVQALSSSSTPLDEIFAYRMVDASGATSDATLTIKIFGSDDPVNVSSITVNEGSPWGVFVVTGGPGQQVRLNLAGDPSGATLNLDFGDPSGVTTGLQYLDSSGNWVAYTASSLIPLDASGQLLVRAAILPDKQYEVAERFFLNVTTTDSSVTTGVGVIVDDGTGDYWADNNKTPTPSVPAGVELDDDRPLSVSGATFNEGAGYIFWTVTGIPGAAGQIVKLSGLNPDSSGSSIANDLSGNLQYRDGSGVWRTFDASASPVLDASGRLLVRQVVVNDGIYEGLEKFKLIVANTGGTDASGISGIIDDGSGLFPGGSGNPPLDPSGNFTDSSGVKDDDRNLTVSGNTYNEAAGYIFWTVSGAPGQTVKFVSLNGDSSGASVANDLSGNLQYRDPSGIWRTFDASASAVLDGSGSMLVRQIVVNDTPYEGKEDFKLIVENTGGTDASGRSSIIDDGTGLLPTLDASGNPTRDPSGNITDSSGVKNDDRAINVVATPNVSEGSNAIFTITLPDGNNRNTEISLSIPAPSPNSGNATPGVDYADASGTAYYFDGSGNKFDLAIIGGKVILPTGVSSFYVKVPTINDIFLEGSEDFSLEARITGGLSDYDKTNILDDGSGNVYKDDGTIDPSGVPDNDRRDVVATGGTYNEGSKYAIYTVSGVPNQRVDASGNIDPSGNPRGYIITFRDETTQEIVGEAPPRQPSSLYSVDGGLTWVPYVPGTVIASPGANIKVLIAVDITAEQDPQYEISEILELSAQDSADTDFAFADAFIVDGGDGDLISLDGSGNPRIDPSGNPILDTTTLKDDDRPLSVLGNTYNENAGYIFWTVKGAAGQYVKFVGLSPDSSGSSIADDLSGNLQYRDPSGIWRTFDASAAAVLDGSGSMLVRQIVVNDGAYEGKEDFKLIVQNTGGTDASGRSSLIDDGTGLLPPLDASGNPTRDPSGNITDSSGVKDDDRTLTVSGNTYNEKSGYIFWTVSGAPGQTVKFSGLNPDSSGASLTDDLSGNLQYRDPSGIWRTFDASAAAVIDGSGSMLVRQIVVNDGAYEGKEDFNLIVENTGGTDASGRSSLIDDGTGLLPTLDASGNPSRDPSGNITDSSGVKDDDRVLTVSGNTFNEGAGYIFWTVNGAAGQIVKFVGLNGDSSGASVADDLSGNLQYRDPSGNWRTFDASAAAVIDASGTLLVRSLINNDDIFEGLEKFKLIVENTGGADASGISGLIDDGTGLKPTLDPSGNPNRDPSGNITDSSGVKDNDGLLTVTGNTFNEAAGYIFWTVKGGPNQRVNFVSLLPDSSGASLADDLSGNLQYRDPSGIWRTFDASAAAVLDGSGSMLVRQIVVNDGAYEGLENFKLIIENSSGIDASGISGIIDNGTGLKPNLDPSGNPTRDPSGNITDSSGVKDDDRPLTVSGNTYNEKSGYIFWTVSGAPGQTVKFVGLNGDSSGASVANDLSGNLQYRDPSGVWRTFDASAAAVIDGSGSLLIRQGVINDSPYEGKEDFSLIVENTGGTDASGRSSIIDDGTGLLPTLDASGNPSRDPSGNITDSSGVKDDDRTLTVSGNTFNEKTGYIFWTVSGAPGQSVRFSGLNPDSSGASVTADLSGNLQYRDTTGVWRTFDASAAAVLDGSGSMLVRRGVINDSIYEGKEDFRLIVRNTGGTDASGRSSLIDDGTGLLPPLDASGNPSRDPSGNITDSSGVIKDDDRPLVVSGTTYNEGGPFIFWTITGGRNQIVQFKGLNGDSSGALPNTDLTGPLQYRDPSGVWRTFDASNNAVFDASGTRMLVRRQIVNDSVYEGRENFRLIVSNTQGTDASGISALIDDGTGLFPRVDPSGNPTLDPSGIPLPDPSGVKDDDRRPTISITPLATVAETDSGTTRLVNFSILLSQAQTSQVTVKYSTSLVIPNGYTILGAKMAEQTDFQQITNALATFQPGVTALNFTTTVIGDNEVESNESYFIKLSENSVNAQIGAGNSEVVIYDNDASNNLLFPFSNSTSPVDLRGGTGNDTLIGGSADDIIFGDPTGSSTGGRDQITGNLGADVLTGGPNDDRFLYPSFTHSTRLSLDRIRDFTPGTATNPTGGDRISLNALPTNLWNRGIVSGQNTLLGAVNAAYADRNASASTNPLLANEAVLFAYQYTPSGTTITQTDWFLAVNDNTQARSDTSDLLINVTGITGASAFSSSAATTPGITRSYFFNVIGS